MDHTENTLEKKRLIKALFIAATIMSVFLVVKIMSDVRAYKFIGQDVAPTRTVSFQGEGEVFAIPDIANISFSAQQDGATVAEAQKTVTTKINAAIAVLKSSGIADADIQTTDYSANPKYDVQPPCMTNYCPYIASKIIGYTVNQTISVKVRDTNSSGALLDGLAKAGVTNISGPDFTIDDPNALQAQARAKAIDDAKAKAKVLADQLGVRLGSIVSFSESGQSPIYYAKTGGAMAMDSVAAPAPTLPVGQNKITSNVTITYEIQ
jgi:uncharacterized protein YggE